MDAKKVKQHCETLCDLIGLAPGDNPHVRRKALGIVRSLRALRNGSVRGKFSKRCECGSELGLVIDSGEVITRNWRSAARERRIVRG